MLISISTAEYEQRRYMALRAVTYRSGDKSIRIAPDALFKIRVLGNGGSFIQVDEQRLKLNESQTERVMKNSQNPRKRQSFPRAEILKDPVAYAEKVTIGKLVAVLKYLDKKYHDEGQNPVPDPVYDAMKEVLEDRSPSNAYLKQTGHVPQTPAAARSKVVLPFYMPSLNKVKLGARGNKSISDWAAKYPGPYVVGDKLDGISLGLVYEPGEPILAVTRGNGNIGQDVSSLVPMMNIPKNIRRKLKVRAEAVLPVSVFKRKYSKANLGDDGFENPRNMSGGIINRLDGGKELKDFRVVVHEIIEPKMTPAKQLQLAKRLGFEVVEHIRIKSLDDGKLTKFLDKRRKASPFEMDGLVLRQADENHTLPKSGKPKYAISFKVDDLENAPTAEVIEVEWNRTRTNYFFPRIRIKPTRLGGVTVNHVSGKNAKFIKDNKIGPGAKIKILRAGDVIPDVVSVVKPSRVVWPDVDFKWTVNKDGERVDIVAVEGTDEVVAKQIEHFFSTMGTEGIKLGTIQKLMNAGMVTVADILKAGAADFMAVEGFQYRSARKLRDNIRQSMSGATFARTGDASGVFGRNIGTRKLEDVYRQYPNIMDYTQRTEKVLVDMLLQVRGVKSITAKSIAQGLPKFREFLRVTGIKLSKPARRVGNRFAGQTIVLTGFRDKGLQQDIESQGGKVGSSVSRSTNALVVKDSSFHSTKVDKAEALGIPVLTAEQFKKRIRG
jgi:DNA ligase (NAD+)